MYYYYKMFLYFYSNPNYKFLYPKKLYEIIKTHNLFGIYDFNIIIYYGLVDGFKIDFLEKKIFPKKELNNLKQFAKKYANIFDY